MTKLVKLILVITLSVILLGCNAAPSKLVVSENPPQHTISVTGNAEVLVVPDEVNLTLGVETWNKDLEQAKAENDQIVKKVLDLTSNFGIESKNVQTDYISVDPRYEDYAQRIFLGYFVRKTIVIKLKDVSKFEDLLSQALEAGVNYVHGIEFRTSELRKYRDQARALAIQAAHEKADAMAKELDQTIGKPINVREEWNNWWYPYNSWWGGNTGNMSQNVVQNAGGTTPPSEGGISLGQISVTASVSVEFELR
jgi:uncharacterized protein YggE